MEQAKKKGESISKQEYIKCYHSAETSTSGGNTMKEEKTKEEKTKKEAPNKVLIDKALEIALDTRKFEIELYWKRTAYFVLLLVLSLLDIIIVFQIQNHIGHLYLLLL